MLASSAARRARARMYRRGADACAMIHHVRENPRGPSRGCSGRRRADQPARSPTTSLRWRRPAPTVKVATSPEPVARRAARMDMRRNGRGARSPSHQSRCSPLATALACGPGGRHWKACCEVVDARRLQQHEASVNRCCVVGTGWYSLSALSTSSSSKYCELRWTRRRWYARRPVQHASDEPAERASLRAARPQVCSAARTPPSAVARPPSADANQGEAEPRALRLARRQAFTGRFAGSLSASAAPLRTLRGPQHRPHRRATRAEKLCVHSSHFTAACPLLRRLLCSTHRCGGRRSDAGAARVIESRRSGRMASGGSDAPATSTQK